MDSDWLRGWLGVNSSWLVEIMSDYMFMNDFSHFQAILRLNHSCHTKCLHYSRAHWTQSTNLKIYIYGNFKDKFDFLNSKLVVSLYFMDLFFHNLMIYSIYTKCPYFCKNCPRIRFTGWHSFSCMVYDLSHKV